MTKRVAGLAGLLGLAFLLSDALIYEPFVVPHLADWKATPMRWSVATVAPELAVCLAATVPSRTAKEWLGFCLLGGFVVTSIQWSMASVSQLGRPRLIEGGPAHFGLQFVTLVLLLLIVVSAMRLIRFWVLRLRQSTP